MDNRKWQAAANATPPADEASPSSGYPTDGNPSTPTPATIPGARWFHQIGEEIRAVIDAAGLTPSSTTLTQLRDAIQAMLIGAQKAVIVSSVTFEASVADGEAVRWDSGNSRFDEAIADGTANNRAVGIADVTNSRVYLYGECPLFSGLTPGARYYLDASTAGAITATAPPDAILVGIAKSATVLWVDVDTQPQQVVPGKNALINGAFDVWQRGTGSTSCPAGSRTFLADRWYVTPTGAAVTQQQSASVPAGARARYSLQIDGAASVTTVLAGQRTEAANIPAIKRTVTVSVKIYNGTGADITPSLLLGTPSVADNFTTVTNRLTQALQSCPNGAWTAVSHSVDISGYTNIDNGLQAEIQLPNGSMTAGKTVRMTEIQIEPGSAATTFDRRDFSAELDMCQRYFETAAAGGQWQGYAVTAYSYYVTGWFSTAKRINPAMSSVYTSGNLGFPASAPSMAAGSPHSFQAGMTCNATTSNAVFNFGWSADAEL